jgi:hypothetical protein
MRRIRHGARRFVSQRRCKALLGLAAIGAFLLALPAAALACVNSCPGGTVGVNGGGFPFCQGGSNNGQLVCSGGSISFDRPFSYLDPWGWMGNSGGQWNGWAPMGFGGEDGGPIHFGSAASDAAEASFNAPNQLGGPVKFSMYSSDSASGLFGAAGVAAARNSGYQVSDSAGTTAGQLPGFHSLSAGGGFNAAADGTRIIGYNGDQRLLFNLNFGYQRDDTQYGTSALTPGVANAGSVNSDIYTLAGSATYTRDTYYLAAGASYDWSHAAITNNVDGGTGNTNGGSYTVGASAGNWFQLYGTTRPSPAMPTKAPPATVGGNALFLTLAGSVNYRNEWNNGFTDTTGFMFGTEQVSFTDLGAQAKLVAVMPSRGFSWMPYVGVSVDRQLGFSHTFDIPTQAATTADTLFIDQSNTFWGVQTGLTILSRSGISAGINGFYSSSADTNIIGGSVSLKIPFYYGPAPTGDSGIRVAAGK